MESQRRVVLVTGAGMGIGQGIALRFAADGAAVVVADINAPAAEQTVEQIRSAGGVASPVTIDIGKVEDCRKAVQSTIDTYGRLDVLVNNAGIGLRKGLLDVTEDEFNRTVNVNMRGPFFCTQAAARVMQPGGVIITITSVQAERGNEVSPVYAATKAALKSFTRSWSTTLGKRGIRVIAVGPGAIDTPDNRNWAATFPNPDEQWERLKNISPLGIIGEPGDIAATCAFLASPEARFITGVTFYVDGGSQR